MAFVTIKDDDEFPHMVEGDLERRRIGDGLLLRLCLDPNCTA